MDKTCTLTSPIGALYRAPDLVSVLMVAEELCQSGRAWSLTWPQNAENQMLVTTGGKEPVDLLIANQIEKAPLHAHVPSDEQMRSIVNHLSGQFRWIQGTTESHVVYQGAAPVGVVGFTGTSTIDGLSKEMAGAVEHLVRFETALQNATLFRYFLGSADKPLLAINESGRILAGTEPGRRLLRIALYGSPLSPYTALEDALPAHILSSILVGHPASSHHVTMTASPFRKTGTSDLIESPILVALSSAEPTKPDISPDRLAKLTPKQKEVLRCLLMGERNKGIAARLKMSIYTARNHVSVILAALGCQDRLELIARYRRNTPASDEIQKLRPVPPMFDAPTIEDFPRSEPAKRPQKERGLVPHGSFGQY